MDFEKEFGKVFAGEDRGIPKGSPEKNTYREKDLIDTIKGHIIGGNITGGKAMTNIIDSESASIINDILKAKKYTDIILKPKTEYVYRGMSISINDFIRMLNQAGLSDNILNTGNGGSISKIDFTFKPKPPRGATSWTSDFNTAFDFAKYISQGSVILVLTANTSDNSNKFFDLDNWYKEIDRNRDNEKEVIGLGNIIVNGIDWLLRK